MFIDPYKDTAFTVLTLTLWGECRGESYDGKVAVASVIWNRAKDYMLKHDTLDMKTALKMVCLLPKQFSCWRDKNEFLQEKPYDCPQWSDCVHIVTSMMIEKFLPVFNCRYYHATSIRPPMWTKELKIVKQIGNHIFYS